MKKILFSCVMTALLTSSLVHANATKRIPQISNQDVRVWKTIIYPTSKEKLTMHRHDHARVLVALTNGKLKVIDNENHVHYLNLKKDTAYYLEADAPNVMHTDENITKHPIKVIVIELNN